MTSELKPMASQQERDDLAQKKEHQQQQVGHMIGKQVIDLLGEPDTLRRVQVQHLWADYYRVNIFVGPDMASSKVAHSYFLTIDGDAAISSSTPRIVKHY